MYVIPAADQNISGPHLKALLNMFQSTLITLYTGYVVHRHNLHHMVYHTLHHAL